MNAGFAQPANPEPLPSEAARGSALGDLRRPLGEAGGLDAVLLAKGRDVGVVAHAIERRPLVRRQDLGQLAHQVDGAGAPGLERVQRLLLDWDAALIAVQFPHILLVLILPTQFLRVKKEQKTQQIWCPET